MKVPILVLGGLLCLGTAVPGQTSSPNTKSTQSANRAKRATSAAGQSVKGCVDEQDGRYVLRDVQTSQLVTLRSPGADADDEFAKFLGHQVEASGTMASGTLTVSHIGQVADMCPVGQ